MAQKFKLMICEISSKFQIFGQKYDFWDSVISATVMFMMHKTTPPFEFDAKLLIFQSTILTMGMGNFWHIYTCGFFCSTLFKTTVPLLLTTINRNLCQYPDVFCWDNKRQIFKLHFTKLFWTFGFLDPWIFGLLDIWTYGHLDPWSLDIRTCGHLDLWTYGHLDSWTFGPMNIWILDPWTFQLMDIRTHGHFDP